jgi:hypothetical protein
MSPIAIAIVACLLVVVFGVGCIVDQGEHIRFVNQSREELWVRVNGHGIAPLPAEESVAYSFGAKQIGAGKDPFRVDVYDARGCVAMVFETTVDDLHKNHHSKLTIQATDLLPLSERTTCDGTIGEAPKE